MKEGQPVPNFEGIRGVSVRRWVANHINVGFANGWQDAIESCFDGGSSTQGAGKGFRGSLGISFNGQAHFGESGVKLSLPQQEIAVSPRNLSGKRISLFSVQKSVVRGDQIGFRFVSGGKIQPGF